VHPKVIELVSHVDAGWILSRALPSGDGGVVLTLERPGRSKELRFDHYEVAAIFHETSVVGLAK
jgi:hypothetical protein